MWRTQLGPVFTRLFQNGRRFVQTQPSAASSGMSFPCLDRLEKRTEQIINEEAEPTYSKATGYKLWKNPETLHLDYGQALNEVEVAYETWGELNGDKTNAVLIHTGLSAPSHAKSHADNTQAGWWEKFIGPGLSIDTDKFFVVCTNVLAGCYGTTGPSSKSPEDGKHYATRFPLVTINDMVRLQHDLISKHFGISKLYASVGSSMGGMQSLAYSTDFPSEVGRTISVSGCARSHPSSIAMRHVQRQALMSDSHWNRGFYYDGIPPHVGMKLAREFATITYRSGPEWEERFGRDRADPSKQPAFCPDFLIETYLDHQGEKFCLQYDPNSLIYISKAMDMFDLGAQNKKDRARFSRNRPTEDSVECVVPSQPYKEQPRDHIKQQSRTDLIEGMSPMAHIPTLVLGVQSDVLFPYWQQREIYEVLQAASGDSGRHEYVELGYDISKFGHDTFLLDVEHVGGPIKRFLEKNI